MIGVGASLPKTGSSNGLSVPYTVNGSTPQFIADFVRETYKADT